MKVLLINKSDATGGAAVVTRRLMEALQAQGVDARMLVVERLTDFPSVGLAASRRASKVPFLAERLKIFLANGFNREHLFKVDTASDGLTLWRHPWVKEADVICLNWINQGMLSLRGIERIAAMGKPIVWTMHDMWNATGICHHAGACDGFKQECGNCHLLGKCSAAGDLSHKVWRKKKALYDKVPLHFVAVSRWLEGRCRCSSLMRDADISVIPNAFPFDDFDERPSVEPGEKLRIVMGAARLDDPIKGFPILIEATRQLRERDSELADRLELVTFGSIRNEELFKQLAISHVHHGMINDMKKIKEIYRSCHIVISTSLFETLPGTLIEGLAHGCLAVAFDSGGQRDIIENHLTGYLATIDDDTRQAARSIVKGIIWAVKHIDGAKYGVVTASHGECGHVPPYNISSDTYRSMLEKFSAPSVAKNYISLFEKLLSQTQRTLNK